MPGMDAQTGKALTGLDHVRQSVRTILSTPVGSRVARREFGSRVPALLGGPLDGQRIADIQAAAIEALERFEKRLRVTSARAESVSAEGAVRILVRGTYIPDGSEAAIEVALP